MNFFLELFVELAHLDFVRVGGICLASLLQGLLKLLIFLERVVLHPRNHLKHEVAHVAQIGVRLPEVDLDENRRLRESARVIAPNYLPI